MSDVIGGGDVNLSGWTLATLRTHLEGVAGGVRDVADERHLAVQALIAAMVETGDKRFDSMEHRHEARLQDLVTLLDERFESQTRSIDKAFDSQETLTNATFATAEKAVETALAASNLAIGVRQDAADKEFHEHLTQYRHETDLAFEHSNRAIGKAESATEKRFEAVNEFRAQLSDQTASFMPREIAEASINELRQTLFALQTRVDLAQGRATGYQAVYGWLVAGIGLLISVVVVANALFSK